MTSLHFFIVKSECSTYCSGVSFVDFEQVNVVGCIFNQYSYYQNSEIFVGYVQNSCLKRLNMPEGNCFCYIAFLF